MAAARSLNVQGVEIPRMGFGTWQLTGDACVQGVRHALEIGYRHIDTARAYANEREVGRGIEESGIDRREIFVTTKVWRADLAPGPLTLSAEASLRELKLEQLDLLLIHWPNPDIPLEHSLDAMRELQDRGLVRLIGVSNFPPGLFRQALEVAPIATNQVEFHPFLAQDELLGIADEHDTSVTAYSPLAHGRVVRDPTVAALAQEIGATPGQLALRWLLHRDRVIVVPKASSPERRAENLGALELELSDDGRERLDALPKDKRYSDPAWAPVWAA